MVCEILFFMFTFIKQIYNESNLSAAAEVASQTFHFIIVFLFDVCFVF